MREKRWKLRAACFGGIAICLLNTAAVAADSPAGKWSTIPITSREILDEGYRGGEGGQWCHALEADARTGSVLFYGTNTGGVYRSADTGKNWTQVNRGFGATGASAFAIDPKNYWNVLALGIGTKADECNGIYLSRDMGSTWKQVLSMPICGNKYYLDGLEFDESSYNRELRQCLRAYCSTPFERDDGGELPEEMRGLLRSDDGGQSWKLVNREMTDAIIKVDPRNGAVYAVREEAAYVSRDYGASFHKIYEGEINGFDAEWRKGTLYLGTKTALLVSRDGGQSFHRVESDTYPEGERGPHGFSVNPSDSQNMVAQSGRNIFYTRDGGREWQEWSYDDRLDFLPFNDRDKVFAWSRNDPGRVFSFGGDFVISSRDGGENWIWDSNGISGFLCGGKFQFNVYNPQLLYLASQDYNGALTTDGGKTWSYVNMSGESWGGFVYGGYAADANVIFAGVAKGWNSSKHLKITFDGGKNVQDTGKKFSGMIYRYHLTSYQSPNDPKVFFAANLRSPDGGKSWKEMKGCLQVYTHNPKGEKELYGCEPGTGYAVVSYDEGKTWERVRQNQEIPVNSTYPYLTDLAFDPDNRLLYALANERKLFVIDLESGRVEELTERLPKDQKGKVRVSGIAVDTSNTDRLYVCGEDERYNRTAAVLYSEDRGKSFQIISSEPGTPLTAGFGGYSIHCIRLHPLTGELWCAAGCYGMQKFVKDGQR